MTKREDDESLIVFIVLWMIPSTITGVLEGFSEDFGAQLEDCGPRLAPWLRYGFFQYMLIFFIIMYFNNIPKKYAEYFLRFLNVGSVSFLLAFIFVVMQLFTPWITLVLYLNVRRNCSDRITSGQGTYYWFLFAFELIVFVAAIFILFPFFRILGEILDESSDRKLCKTYSKQVLQIVRFSREQRLQYTQLLSQNHRYVNTLYSMDLKMFKMLLCRRLNIKCVEMLKMQHRHVCFTCKFQFQVEDRVIFMEGCRHLAHWECFLPTFVLQKNCSECGQGSVIDLKQTIINSNLQNFQKLLTIPPKVRPSFEEANRENPIPQIQPFRRRHRMTIEYFNYTVNHKNTNTETALDTLQLLQAEPDI